MQMLNVFEPKACERLIPAWPARAVSAAAYRLGNEVPTAPHAGHHRLRDAEGAADALEREVHQEGEDREPRRREDEGEHVVVRPPRHQHVGDRASSAIGAFSVRSSARERAAAERGGRAPAACSTSNSSSSCASPAGALSSAAAARDGNGGRLLVGPTSIRSKRLVEPARDRRRAAVGRRVDAERRRRPAAGRRAGARRRRRGRAASRRRGRSRPSASCRARRRRPSGSSGAGGARRRRGRSSASARCASPSARASRSATS